MRCYDRRMMGEQILESTVCGARPRRWAIVPVKRLEFAKQRLAEALGPRREEFARLLALRTVDILTRSGLFAEILVVTSDPRIASGVRAAGATVIDDDDRSLNAAYSLGLDTAFGRGADICVLLPADLATLTPGGVSHIVSRYQALRDGANDGDIVALVRSKDGSGTNMVLLDRQSFKPAFGRGSFEAHMRALNGHGRELDGGEAAFDIDTIDDLRDLIRTLREFNEPDISPDLRRLLSEIYLELGEVRRAPMPEASVSALLDAPLVSLLADAVELRDRGHANLMTYSPKVFLPLTQLCRDSCHYCTFAKSPKRAGAPYMTLEQVVTVAGSGAAVGCKEALFTLGDRPEARYRVAREWLDANGIDSTLEYVRQAAAAVRDQTGLLPHINAGCMTPVEMAMLRPVCASMGLMLESASDRLCGKGGPHFGSPDKAPAVRLAVIEEAGRQRIPFTTGILIGIGETRRETVESLMAIRDLHERYGHIQEIIVQNFVPKPGTRMADVAPPPLEELIWTIAVARILFGPQMSIQAPPNLSPTALVALVGAGINDWGGVSPLTPDFVNPESPWPSLERLRQQSEAAGKILVERLTIYPRYAREPDIWLDSAMRQAVLELSDGAALGREDHWRAGRSAELPDSFAHRMALRHARMPLARLLDEIVEQGADSPDVDAIARLFEVRGSDFHRVCEAADRLRSAANGDVATYVINRNINYTNICGYRCTFCAFSKGPRKHAGAEKPYLLDMDEIGARVGEARDRGASEVCLQGGIHPSFTGETYLDIVAAVKRADPAMHVHAFSPLEVWHGASTLGMKLADFLALLRKQGLGSLPGTAAEILHDPVRRVLCPDKLTTDQWLKVIESAHGVGLKTTATIMFGHVDGYQDWAIHLHRLRDLQRKTGGFTEFVPLPFVAHEAPIYKRGKARPGPTLREAVLMHAVARLVLHPYFVNIQTSWVKMGREGMRAALRAGANDLGGTLMNESITRAAGAIHGQEMTVAEMRDMAGSLGRRLTRRTTLYGHVHPRSAQDNPVLIDDPIS
jgi:FO synthase